MIFLLLSILCSTVIILIFKVLANYKVHGFHAIIINYWVCVVTGLLSGAVAPSTLLTFFEKPWLPISLLLGLLFIGGFYAINLTVKHNGITVASIVSKNAMVISVTAAFFLYGDVVNLPKIIGIVAAIAAIILTSARSKGSLLAQQLTTNTWIYPLLAFLVSGTIETLLKYTQEYHLAPGEQPVFLIFLFGTAAAIGTIIYMAQFISARGKTDWSIRVLRNNWLGGLLLGIPNYGSIYFLIKTLEQPNWESSVVYPVNNIGVVLFSSGFAYLFFAEKFNRIKLVGIGLAIIAIGLIAWGTQT